jgi:hypothetical protein
VIACDICEGDPFFGDKITPAPAGLMKKILLHRQLYVPLFHRIVNQDVKSHKFTLEEGESNENLR